MKTSSEIIKTSGVAFGTSGARALVSDLTPETCMAFAASFTAVMKQSFSFKRMALGIDNRPSSYAIAQSCAAALSAAGIDVWYCGVLPTPALAYAAMQADIPCIMVTGSHIPFDRNGLKFYRPDGEISKADELAILNTSAPVDVPNSLPALVLDSSAAEAYVERYVAPFDSTLLAGKKIGIYEHSSSGRDLYASLFSQLGAEVQSLERSDEFVPIDTEAVAEEDKTKARAWSKEYGFDAIFSTDGDGDRPLIADENGEWLRGDVLGLLCSQALSVDALAVPVSCNTAIELSDSFDKVVRTKIGSPYVIEAFAALAQEHNNIAGFEANGGFLLGSDVDVNGKLIKALPTRDAVLPALMLLSAAKDCGIAKLVAALPQRFTDSDRIKNFATVKSKAIIAKAVEEGIASVSELMNNLGFDGEKVESFDITDGLRINLSDATIVHLRPSGNAPELRCYAESDNPEASKRLVQQALNKVQTITI
ncbi:MAG: phosphomannomutase [Flavobacteriales bacterium]|jgi:phosphomannomutase